MEAIKCRVCGATPTYDNSHNQHWIICPNCDSGINGKSKADAIGHWNDMMDRPEYAFECIAEEE